MLNLKDRMIVVEVKNKATVHACKVTVANYKWYFTHLSSIRLQIMYNNQYDIVYNFKVVKAKYVDNN